MQLHFHIVCTFKDVLKPYITQKLWMRNLFSIKNLLKDILPYCFKKRKKNIPVSVTLFYVKDKILREYTNLFLLPTKVMHKSYKSSFGICFSLFYVFAHIFHWSVDVIWNGGNRESFSIALYLNAMRNKFKCAMQVNYCLNIDLTFLINLNCSVADTDKLKV